MQRKTVSLLVALLLFSAIPLNVSADETDDIPTNASSTGVHDSLVAALTHADLVATLQGDGPFTVFAPTDQAFADAGIDLSNFDNDEANATLVDILTYHVVSGSVMSSDLVDAGTADALNGDKLSFTVGTSEVKVNDAVVTSPDVISSNGVIHVIDKVLMPPVDIYVSDGSMSEPYFQFYSDSAGTTTVDELDITNNYKFQRLSNPSAHPFYVGDSGYNSDSSDNLIIAGDGSSSAGISDAESFTLFFRDGFSVSDTLSYFCTVHSNMVSDFTLTAPVELVDIPTVATGTGIHTSLVAAVVQAELLETLQGDGPFTVFAPTDDAFADAGIDLSTFETDEEIAALADILTYHVVAGSVLSSDLEDKTTVTAVNGDSLAFAVSADGVMVNDANVVAADVLASNGVIHVIDKVLMPPIEIEPDIPTVAARTGVHTALVAALTQADLVTTLQGDGPFTVFAPTDDAFAAAGIDLTTFDTDEEIAALVDILLFHVYSGAVNAADVTDGLTVTMVNGDEATFTVSTDGTVMVGDATVTSADVIASNGVIHVIDEVLMPPADLGDIPTVAAGTEIHTSLVAAVVQAGLLETLQSEGPFTLFAPTDEAFAAAGIDLAALDTPEGKAILTNILLYHVVPGTIMSSDLTVGVTTVTAANEDSLMVHVTDSGVMVGTEMAMVTLADVPASNGVIHVIDKVLTPPADNDVTCDVTIGISSDGYAFSPAAVTIDV
ncbi:MAG: fasciclin domain-containing protein, partial [Euryarchaeota archaeon]|nr:fasciclin domain-containing protein [Euryarchaeota archaeon]